MMFEAVLMSSWHVGVLFLLLRKVKKLFQTMDASGDGTINLQEFSKLVQQASSTRVGPIRLLDL